MTPKPLFIAVSLLLFAGGLACKPKPSEAFVEQVKNSLRSKEKPGFTLNMGLPMEGGSAKAGELRSLAEVLGNKLGFRIEIGHSRKGFLQVATYTFQDFHAPSLPGLSFEKEGSTVKILADFRWDIVIESVLPPKDGFETTQGKGKSAAEREKEIAVANALGFKDAAKATDADIANNKEKRKERTEAFSKAVEQVCKDNGYARAWFVTYRKKGQGTVPRDSPFFSMVDAWTASSGSSDLMPLMPNATAIIESHWLEKHGEIDVKETLTEYCLVAFEDKDGKLTKTENWKAFLSE